MRLRVRSPWIVIVMGFLLPLGLTPAAHAILDTAFAGLSQTVVNNTNVNLPGDLALDAAGNAFIVDSGNNRIVELTAQGNVSPVSITGLTLPLNSPSGIAVDGADNLYIADTGNNRVVQVAASGAGSVVSMGSVTLSSPQGIAVDLSGDIFIADTGNNRIVEVTSGTSAAALNIAVSSGVSTLSSPSGLAVNVAGTLYVADAGNNRIVTVAAASSAGVVLGIDTSQLGGQTALDLPQAVALDAFGTVYIADTGDSQCLRVNPPVDVTSSAAVFASSLNKSAVGFGHVQLGSSNGVTLTLPFQVGFNETLGTPAAGVLLDGVASLDFTVGGSTTCTAGANDADCSVQIKFLPTAPGLRTGAVVLYDNSSPQNQILTIPLYGWSDSPIAVLAPNTGTVIDSGGVTTSAPFQLALDGRGNIYTADSSGMNAAKISAGGGSGAVLNTGGITLGTVAGIAVDGAGNVFLADNTDSDIVVVTPQGLASVLTIHGLYPSLSTPAELNFDAAGNLYIADAENSRIVVVTGLQVIGGTSSGTGSAVATGAYMPGAQLYSGIAVDPKGTIYIADGVNNRILQVTAAGLASVLSPTGITFSDPEGLAVDGMGNLYIADTGNNRIVEIATQGAASVVSVAGLPAPAALSSPTGLAVDASGNLYIADSGNNRIVYVNVSGAALTFSSTAPGSTSNDSPMTATVTNLGNQSLALSANPAYTSNFSRNSSDTNLCGSTTSLAAGASCDVAVNFTPQSTGSLSASITVTDNTLNVAGSTQQVSVSGTGGKNTPTIDWTNPAPITYGATLSGLLNASASNGSTPVPGTFTYTATPTGGSASGVTSATVLSAGTYTLGVSFTPTDTTTYAVATGQVTLVVNQATPSITWAAPAAITYGAALSSAQLNASSTVAGSFVYTPASGTVEPAGQHTLSVTLTPTDSTDYATVTAQVELTVNKVTPTITWATPAAINAGTALSATQLNATSTVAGSFAYTPSAGTVESAGQQSLSVILTPTDTTDYTTATAMVTLAVKGMLSIVWHPATTTISYGTTLSGILNASATAGDAVVPGIFTYQAEPPSGDSFNVTKATVLPATTYTLLAEFQPTDGNAYQPQTATVTFTVKAETPVVVLASSANPVLTTNPITFTATMTAAYGTPTGNVNFFDGTAQLATVTLSAGSASFKTSSLAVGTHSITAVYSGDANFVAASSPALAESVVDLNIAPPSGSGTSQTVPPGGTAVYMVNISPGTAATFPAPVTLSLSGYPPQAAVTLSPISFPANSPESIVTLDIQVPDSLAEVSPQRKQPWERSIPLVYWGILLLPFGVRLRRAGRRLGKPISFLLLLAVGFAAVDGMIGCGASNGASSQPQKTYTMTLTATSGSLSRDIILTLTVE